ncbi:hypothetical protein [Sandaracinus amylolyticus]|uniref:Uncharacterized protein n=1 Tax=Sandaracinus amylolyticus TaxID=927083 RepID=A0A0F6W4K8_9BACT|nr:hypothetical protein [Sandaracinus amylolyticus]AKF07165.1 hypothetical protein DB32_004314 [Sandaracinus amylolyticus]
MQERRLKGVNFHGTLRALERRYGDDVLARVRARVEGPGGVALRDGEVVTNGWYPASWYDALLASIEREIPSRASDEGVCRELSRAAVVEDFSTLFRVISLVVSPRSALVNATRIVSRYVDGGRITVIDAREGHIHFAFDEFHGYTRRMWDDFLGGIEAVIDLMRLTRLPSRVISGGQDGDARFEVVIRYQR